MWYTKISGGETCWVLMKQSASFDGRQAVSLFFVQLFFYQVDAALYNIRLTGRKLFRTMFQFVRCFFRDPNIEADILGFVGLWSWGQFQPSFHSCVYNYYNCIHRNVKRLLKNF